MQRHEDAERDEGKPTMCERRAAAATTMAATRPIPARGSAAMKATKASQPRPPPWSLTTSSGNQSSAV